MPNLLTPTLSTIQFPTAATTPNQKGKIPLHYAAREGRLDMVRYFLRTTPTAATIATSKGKLALHFAAGEGHEAITFALLWQYPRSATLPSTKGKLALHFCARWGYVSIAHGLLRVYPDAVRALDWEGSLPLHDAAREGQVRMSRVLMDRFPTAVQICNLRGEIPLFPAVRSGCVELVVLLLQAWPKGAKEIFRNVGEDDTIEGWSPEILELLLRAGVNRLHESPIVEGLEPPSIVMTNDVEPSSAVKRETSEQKECRKQKSKKPKHNGAPSAEKPLPRLAPAPDPLSLGYAFSSPRPTAAALPAADLKHSSRCKSPMLGGSGSLKLDGGRKRKRSATCMTTPVAGAFIPLLAALEVKASYVVIQHILEQRPEDVRQQDGKGRFALHWAALHTTDERIVDLVVDKMVHHEAAQTVDTTGQLPLHLAIGARADARLIHALLQVYPAAGIQRCPSWRGKVPMSPMAMAITMNCDLSTLFQLIRVHPVCIGQGVRQGLRARNRDLQEQEGAVVVQQKTTT